MMTRVAAQLAASFAVAGGWIMHGGSVEAAAIPAAVTYLALEASALVMRSDARRTHRHQQA